MPVGRWSASLACGQLVPVFPEVWLESWDVGVQCGLVLLDSGAWAARVPSEPRFLLGKMRLLAVGGDPSRAFLTGGGACAGGDPRRWFLTSLTLVFVHL